jgi:hypothetical protein
MDLNRMYHLRSTVDAAIERLVNAADTDGHAGDTAPSVSLVNESVNVCQYCYACNNLLNPTFY